MRFVDEYRDADTARALAAQIAALCEPGRQYKFMEVCGGHTHTIYKHGLEDYLPENVTLVHGPGCPVCVIPMGRVDDAIAIAEQPDVILTSLRRHDARARRHAARSSTPRPRGADIRMVYSPLDALKIARQNPDRRVVFMAIGFETTAPSTAMTVLRAAAEGIDNFSVFCNHVTIIPAIKAILDSPDLRLDGFIGPGHVSTVIGCRPYEFIARDYGKPLVVRRLRAAGHPAVDLHAACGSSPRAAARWRTSTPGWCRGTATRGALQAIGRGDGAAARTSSGAASASSRTPRCRCATEYAAFDAERHFAVPGVRVADPKACQCGEVLKGVLKPWECKVFGTACTPETPIGTCMVSSEGACAAYYNFGRFSRERRGLTTDARGLADGRRSTSHDRVADASREQQVLDRDRAAPAPPAAGTRGAHHAGPRRRRQGDAHPDRGGVPRGVPQPALAPLEDGAAL